MPEVWRDEAKRIWDQFKKHWEKIEKHHIDIYEGRDSDNPPITTRLLTLEVRVTTLELKDSNHEQEIKSRQKELRGYIIGLILAVLGDAVIQIFFKK